VRYNAAFPWNTAGPGPYGVGIEDDATGNLIMYFHLASNSVTVGQRVKPGDLVGVTGALGMANGNHAHIEIREAGHWEAAANNYNLDPIPYLNNAIGADMTVQEIAASVEQSYFMIGVNAFPMPGESVANYQARIGNDLDHQVAAVMSGNYSLHDVTTNILKTKPH
jgi:hypothetical protein